MQGWWRNRTDREQWIIRGGVIFVAAFLLYSFLWSPWQVRCDELRTRVLEQHEIIRIMHQAHQRFPVEMPLHGVVSNKLLPTLEHALSRVGLDRYLKGVKQKNRKQLELAFKSVPFDALRNFLKNLWKNNGVYTQAIVIDRAKVNGTVDVSLTLVTSV